MLKVENLEVYYHHIHALAGISFEVNEGEIVALLGANGAGKTTTLAAISGLVKICNGAIRFLDQDITPLKPHQIVQLGITQVPEGRGIFEPLTVMENLQLGGWTKKNSKKQIAYVFEIFPLLYERRAQVAGTLSGGEQQMLAIGRALVSNPKLLLLDEPSLGLAPKLIERIFKTIARINQEGTSILLVEQNAYMSLNIAHRGYIFETGKIILAGKSDELVQNELVKKAYLGH
ncbi:MAG: ABC transporter ATP-binding protein [bacterium]